MTVRRDIFIPLWIQVILYAVSALCFALLVYKASTVFTVHDSQPALIDPAVVKKRTQVPLIPVYMSFFIRDFVQFDIVHNTVVLDGIITAVFDKSKISLDTVGKFGIEQGDLTRKSDPVISTKGNQVTARWDVRISLTPNFNFRAFPLDSHRLTVVIANYAVEPSSVMIVSSNEYFTMDQHIAISGWNFIGKSVNSGFSFDLIHTVDEHAGYYFPRVMFSIDCKRHDINHLLAILLPMVGLFFLALLVFSYSVTDFMDSYMSLALAMLAYRFVIQTMAPDTTYFMLSDYLFLLFLGAIFLSFFVNILVEYRSVIVKFATICMFHCAVLVSCILFFYKAMGHIF